MEKVLLKISEKIKKEHTVQSFTDMFGMVSEAAKTDLPLALGSPPQVRGKLPVRTFCLRRQRITPAGAGKTHAVGFPSASTADHPRRCGENVFVRVKRAERNGSPPQVRGKPSSLLIPTSSIRITPAGAGKTIFPLIHSGSATDHPRRCGENGWGLAPFLAKAGSPPQVRGKLADCANLFRRKRITPAGAGKTVTCRCRAARWTDHPRRCGENKNLFS